ncbi:hypothetical protein D3C76_1665220 [compost metagenome]
MGIMAAAFFAICSLMPILICRPPMSTVALSPAAALVRRVSIRPKATLLTHTL